MCIFGWQVASLVVSYAAAAGMDGHVSDKTFDQLFANHFSRTSSNVQMSTCDKSSMPKMSGIVKETVSL